MWTPTGKCSVTITVSWKLVTTTHFHAPRCTSFVHNCILQPAPERPCNTSQNTRSKIWSFSGLDASLTSLYALMSLKTLNCLYSKFLLLAREPVVLFYSSSAPRLRTLSTAATSSLLSSTDLSFVVATKPLSAIVLIALFVMTAPTTYHTMSPETESYVIVAIVMNCFPGGQPRNLIVVVCRLLIGLVSCATSWTGWVHVYSRCLGAPKWVTNCLYSG